MRKILIGALVSFALMANAQTPVAKYGQLKIVAGKVSDKNGNPVVLRGMSLFWSGYPEGSPFYNATTIKWLRDDWCVDVVRAAMSVETGTNGTYVSNPAAEQAKIEAVIDACIANGLYVIVDFHTHNAPNYLTQAQTFFSSIATKYGNTPNVLYEPYNEPIAQAWSSSIKPYHNSVISTIRAKDPDNIIICGTRQFSQEVEEAANDPVTGTNIAYTLHYYANSHKGELRTKATAALNKGVALFVTEYGTCDASGNTGYNAAESQVWWDYVEANKLSTCNWSVCYKNETASILNANVLSNWTSGQITQSGALVKAYLKSKCGLTVATGTVTLSFTPAGKVQYNAGETVTISAATTVSTGTVARVDFFDGTTLIGSKTGTSPYVFTTTTLSSGGHNISARSYDATTGGNLIAVSATTPISIVGASNVSTTGITDAFETVKQFSELTGGLTFPTGATGTGPNTSCATATDAAAAGIYWFEDVNPATPFAAKATRAGDGKLKYVISQAANAYNVVGFNFGDYCLNGVKTKYALDLSGTGANAAVFKLTVNAPATNTASLDLKIQMKDADGTVLAINNALVVGGKIDTSKTTTTPWYKYEIGFSKNHDAPDFKSLAPNTTTVFEFNFKNALSIKNPNNPVFPRDININNSDFDFSKVVEIVIIPVNKLDNGATGTPAYAPLAFTDQTIIFSGLSLGIVGNGTDICTTPPAPTATAKAYCQGAEATALVATGIAGLNLQWYGTSATGGTASTTAPTPSTTAVSNTTYYVSQKVGIGTCESPRTPIAVSVTAGNSANAGTPQTSAVGPTVDLKGTGSAVGTWSLVSSPASVTTTTFTPSANAANVTASGLTAIGSYTFKYTVPAAGSCAAISSNVDVEVTSVTSVSDEFLNSNIEMYPNPVSDNLYINMNKVDGAKSLKLVDMFGKTIFESSNTENVTVPMNNLNAGMYIIQIQTGSGVLTKTIMKK